MRRRRAPVREIPADYKYRSELVSKFVNNIMYDGKKSVAEDIFYGAIDLITERTGKEGIDVFNQAINNVKPMVEVRPKRIGGQTYQVPMEVQKNKGYSIAMHWLRDFSRAKKGKSLARKLAEEIVNAYKNEGPIIKKRDDTHKMAEANKAFAHFRF